MKPIPLGRVHLGFKLGEVEIFFDLKTPDGGGKIAHSFLASIFGVIFWIFLGTLHFYGFLLEFFLFF